MRIKMNWSTAILLLLVGAALAQSPKRGAFHDGKEYTYKMQSRTMTAFNQQSKQFSGVVMEATVTIQAKGQDSLRAKLSQARYMPVHTRLENGWDSEIPRSQMNSQNLPVSSQPFEIKMKKGQVSDLVVDKNVPTWELNIYKAIVSQIQVDAQGESAEQTKHNQLPEGKQPYAVFKTKEDSVGGRTEVLYDISPLPEQVLQSNPELVPMPELRGNDGEFISIVKTKNYSNTEQRVSYHYGISGRNDYKPGSNDNGKYLSRSSVTRVVISGDVRQHTIQSSVTINKVMHGADSEGNQHGMVASKMNMTLEDVKEISERLEEPQNPQSTGSLVYNYNNPNDKNSRRPNQQSQDEQRRWSRKQQDKRSSSKNSRDNESRESSSEESNSDESLYDNDNNNYMQPKPKLTEAPETPLLPFYVGNGGSSIQKDNRIDVVKSAKQIAQQIGKDVHKPDSMVEEQTLEKFTILTRLVRTMNAEQIAELKRETHQPKKSGNEFNREDKSQSERRSAWEAVRDSIAQAGTGPALVNVKQLIQNKEMEDSEAAEVVDAVSKSARTPTPEFMEAFFEMVKQQENKESPLRDATVTAFASLIRHAIVDKQSAHNRYPVHVFGRLVEKENNDLHEKYIPYIAEQLKKAVEQGDSKRVQLYTVAMGKTGDSHILSVFEPYIEGKKQVSPFQRFMMVFSMDKLAELRPKLARSVLYKIYANTADHHEIRTAAVYLLMKTNPPASMLQRMAEFTNLDSNKQVNSAVKSMIESLANLEDDEELREISNAAKSAKPLLTSERFGPEHSRAVIKKFKNPITQSSITVQANYIGSEDSIIPKGVYLSLNPSVMGMKESSTSVGIAVSSIRDLADLVKEQMSSNKKRDSKNNQESQDDKFSPEKIARILGIHGKEPNQVEGLAFITGELASRVKTFDNHTLEKMPREFKKIVDELKQGKNYERTKLYNREVTISFPTETGLPFYSTYKTPVIMSIKGEAKLRTDSDSDSENKSSLPKSVTASGKTRVVLGMKIQERFGFVVPFENQEYIMGLDKNLQVHLPVQSEVEFDKNKKEIRVRVQPRSEDPDVKVLQYKTQPFTSKHDIMSLEPVSKDKNTHTIHQSKASKSQVEISSSSKGQKVQFNFERQLKDSEKENEDSSEKKMQNAMESARKMAHSIASMFVPRPSENEYEKYSVKLTPQGDMSFELRVSADSMTTESNQSSNEEDSSSPSVKVPFMEKNLDERQRKEKLLKEAAKNMNSAQVSAIDISVHLGDNSEPAASLTASMSKSFVDQKSRVFLYARSNPRDFHFSAGVETKSPNTISLDYQETLKANTRRELDGEIRYGKDGDNSNTIRIQGSAKQTENRKNEIRQSRDAQQCSKEESRNGNKMSPACERANQRAASVNSGELTITFPEKENSRPSWVKSLVLKAVDAAESAAKQQSVETLKDRENREEKNKVRISYETSADDQEADVEVKTPEAKYQFKNIKMSSPSNKRNNENEKDNNGKEDSEAESNAMGSVCFMDKTQLKSFDNRRIPTNLGKCWHVAMTAFPKKDADSPSQEKEIPEDQRVSVLVRENDEGKKELKITLGDKEVELKPSESESESNRVSAKINGESIQFSQWRSHQHRKNGEVEWELFRLHDRSAKLVSKKYDVYVIYDGYRAKVKAGNRYRDSVRGLCGDNNGESEDDQRTPQGYLLQKPEEFAATYALTSESQCEGPAKENAERAKKAPRVFLQSRPGNVISDREAHRKSDDENRERKQYEEEKRCTRQRTMVQKTDSQICFSKRPVPSCSSKCQPSGTRDKKVEFHCVPRNSSSEKIAKRVEDGANPDLSQKQTSKTDFIQVPVSCKA